MSILSELEPSVVYRYFEDIAAIPHGSGNTDRISEYIEYFAIHRSLDYVKDESGNVIIFKNGQNGGETSDTVILQGHMDMVCEKDADMDIDLELEGLRLKVEDGMISAEGTTLGGDDGIAVAYMLAILDDKDMPHPPLECVFTVDEEIGMLGAMALDMSRLSGKKLLNIDSEEEGYLLVSCAGGATVDIRIPILRRGAQGNRYTITVSGLLGGHSGVEIDKGRANADIVLGRLLKEILMQDDSMRIVYVEGGLKDNAIPNRARAEIVSKNYENVRDAVDSFLNEILEEYKETDPDINIALEEESVTHTKMYPLDELQNMQFTMLMGNLPYGVRAMSPDLEGLVQTSLNLGIMYTTENEICITYSVRSSVSVEKQNLIDELILLARSVGGTASVNGMYPAWEYKKDSSLQKVMTDTYKELYGEEMIVQSIHAGVECGIFSDAIEGLEAVSFGPDIYDIHTPKERLNISSVKRTWNYIRRVLEYLTLAICFLVCMNGCSKSDEDALVPANEITYTHTEKNTVQVQRGELDPSFDVTLSLAGYKEQDYSCNEKYYMSLYDQYEMELDEVKVNVGDVVHKGDTLVSFKSENLDDQKSEKQKELKEKRLELEHLKKLMEIDSSTDYTADISKLQRDINVDEMYITDIQQTYDKINLVAEADGEVIFINESLKNGYLELNTCLIKTASNDGYYTAEVAENIILKPGEKYTASNRVAEYELEVVNKAELTKSENDADTGIKSSSTDAEKESATSTDATGIYYLKPVDTTNVQLQKEMYITYKIGVIKDACYVNRHAIIMKDDGKSYVYIVTGEGKRKAVRVEVGDRIGDDIIIKSGLDGGEELTLP